MEKMKKIIIFLINLRFPNKVVLKISEPKHQSPKWKFERVPQFRSF